VELGRTGRHLLSSMSSAWLSGRVGDGPPMGGACRCRSALGFVLIVASGGSAWGSTAGSQYKTGHVPRHAGDCVPHDSRVLAATSFWPCVIRLSLSSQCVGLATADEWARRRREHLRRDRPTAGRCSHRMSWPHAATATHATDTRRGSRARTRRRSKFPDPLVALILLAASVVTTP